MLPKIQILIEIGYLMKVIASCIKKPLK